MIATENASKGQLRSGNAESVRAHHVGVNVRHVCASGRLTLATLGGRLRTVPLAVRSVNPLRTAATLLAVSLCAQVATAGFPESYERWERTYGVGWGDGYHASAPSGTRPFADLPPKFPRRTEPRGQRSACPGCATRHPTGNTYYDRFDAYAASLEESPDLGNSVLVGRSNETSNADRTPRDTSIGATRDGSNPSVPTTSDRHHSASRHPVRPGLTNARLPTVLQPATGLHAEASRHAGSPRHTDPTERDFGEHGTRTPRVAQTPESLIIRQPR